MADDTPQGAAPPPLGDLLVTKEGALTPPWSKWFAFQPAPPSVTRVISLAGQEASIAATDFSGVALQGGLYRASYHARITRAATTSSTLTVTLSWTDSGIAKSVAGAAITGNTTATVQSGVLLIRVDKGSAIRYATTYGSVGAVTMQYGLDVVLERIKP